MSPLPDEVKKATTTSEASPFGEDIGSHDGNQQETRQSGAPPMADDNVEIIEVQDSAPIAPNATSDVDTLLTNVLAGDLDPWYLRSPTTIMTLPNRI